MSQLQGSQRLSPEIIAAEHALILTRISEGDAVGAARGPGRAPVRARELLAAALGGEPGPEAFRPSTALPR